MATVKVSALAEAAATTGNTLLVVEGGVSKKMSSSIGSAQVLTALGYTPLPIGYVATAVDYLVLVTDSVVGVTDTSVPRTINLPPAALAIPGRPFTIKDESGGAGTNNITINTAAGNIDGLATYTINVGYGALTVYSNSVNWFVK